MTEQAAIKPHFAGQFGVDPCETFVFAVQEQRPLHVTENLLRTTRRTELGVRCEPESYEVLSHSIVLKAKSLKKGIQKIPRLFGIVALLFLPLMQLVRVGDELLNAPTLGLSRLPAKGLPIDR